MSLVALMNSYDRPEDRVVLPPPSALGGMPSRPSLPPLGAASRWEETTPRAAPTGMQLPSIHSMSRSSTTPLPTPSTFYDSRPSSSRYSPYERRVHPPSAHSPPHTHTHAHAHSHAHAQAHAQANAQMHGHSQGTHPHAHVKPEPDMSPPLRGGGYYPMHPRVYDVRGRSVSDAGARRESEVVKHEDLGQTRRLAHLMSEQKRRESINTGFASLRSALPTAHPTDSKAVVLRKAVARIQQLEQLAGIAPPSDAAEPESGRRRAWTNQETETPGSRFVDWDRHGSRGGHGHGHGHDLGRDGRDVHGGRSQPVSPQERYDYRRESEWEYGSPSGSGSRDGRGMS